MKKEKTKPQRKPNAVYRSDEYGGISIALRRSDQLFLRNKEDPSTMNVLIYVPFGTLDENTPGGDLARELLNYPQVNVGITEHDDYSHGVNANVILSCNPLADEGLKEHFERYEGKKRVVLTTREYQEQFNGRNLDEVVESLRKQLVRTNSI